MLFTFEKCILPIFKTKMVETFSFLLICHINAWGQMWDIRRHLWKWVNRKVDFMVVHVETSYIQRGGGGGGGGGGGREIRCGRVWKGSRKASGPNRQTVWERVRDVVGFDTKGGPS